MVGVQDLECRCHSGVFLHFPTMARAMASFLPFYDFHDPNALISLRHDVAAAINLPFQPH